MTRQEAAALTGGGSFEAGGAGASHGVGGVSMGGATSGSGNGGNPANRLVPYLDLFSRLGDEELARLAGVPASVAEQLRLQVDEVCRALGRYDDLLPRLRDEELARLTGASPKTIRFWRLCKMRPVDLDVDAAPRASAREPTPIRGHEVGAGVPAPVASSPSTPHELTPAPAAAPAAAAAPSPGSAVTRPAAARPAAAAVASAGVSGEPFPGATPKGVPPAKSEEDEDIFAGVFDDEEEDGAGKDPLDITQDDDFF
jgi:hypothetical protein